MAAKEPYSERAQLPARAPIHYTVDRDASRSGCGSPLYNPNFPAAELDEALQRIRAGLANAPQGDRTNEPAGPRGETAARSQAHRA
jgi:hypothetical protein